MRARRRILTGIGVGLAIAALSSSALAQDADPASDTARFVFDTGLALFGGLAGLIVLAGFCLRDVGLARVQYTPAVCLRVMGALGVTILAFWLTGFALMDTVEPGGLLGEFGVWRPIDEDPVAAGYAASANWFFQMTLAAIGVAIISGAVSERVKLWPFLTFTAAFGALIYPIIAGWVWGGGYLRSVWSFYDFGGGAVIHMAAGASAFAAAMVIGPRPGKYNEDGEKFSPSTALPLSVLGAVLILAGGLCILGALNRSAATVEAVISISTIFANASAAVGAGVITALFITKAVYKRAGLVTGLSAILGALAAISADPLHPTLWQAGMIGAIGGVIVAVAPPFLDRLRIDDASFAVPTHYLCGLWGVLLVPWTNPDAWILGQLIGAALITGFAFMLTTMIWAALRYTVGVRSLKPDDHPFGKDAI